MNTRKLIQHLGSTPPRKLLHDGKLKCLLGFHHDHTVREVECDYMGDTYNYGLPFTHTKTIYTCTRCYRSGRNVKRK